ncbi:MAG: hypothetical protein Pg6A_18580 [Termitinemataceae bacterium]|nr:MAG: hypothetical protein Pg6A_18580 [Termitinemataceae bacterium]
MRRPRESAAGRDAHAHETALRFRGLPVEAACGGTARKRRGAAAQRTWAAGGSRLRRYRASRGPSRQPAACVYAGRRSAGRRFAARGHTPTKPQCGFVGCRWRPPAAVPRCARPCCRPRPALARAGDAHAHETALRFRGLPVEAACGGPRCARPLPPVPTAP